MLPVQNSTLRHQKAKVKVLKFSIGFGRAIKSWRGKDGVEFVIAPIPLGGYVKMLGQEDTKLVQKGDCLLYTSPSPRDGLLSRMPSSA